MRNHIYKKWKPASSTRYLIEKANLARVLQAEAAKKKCAAQRSQIYRSSKGASMTRGRRPKPQSPAVSGSQTPPVSGSQPEAELQWEWDNGWEEGRHSGIREEKEKADALFREWMADQKESNIKLYDMILDQKESFREWMADQKESKRQLRETQLRETQLSKRELLATESRESRELLATIVGDNCACSDWATHSNGSCYRFFGSIAPTPTGPRMGIAPTPTGPRIDAF